MEDLFRGFWWLLFPLGWFLVGAWDRWLSYRQSREELELFKAYAAQGKEPPVELLRRIRREEADVDLDLDMGLDEIEARRGRRHRRRRPGSDEIHSAIYTGAIGGAFWIASELSLVEGAEGPFRLVAVILTCITVALLISGLLASRFRDR